MKEGWKNKPLGSVCRIYNGNSINADYKKEHFLGLKEGYPFIATKDVSFDGRIEYENGVKIPIDAGLKVANPDSVFICVEGGSAGRKIGFIEHQVCFGNKLFCLTPKLDIKGKFLYYYLNSEVFQKQFSERLTGLIGGVSAKKFNEIEIAFPPLSEQQKIVEYLDTSFAKIDAMKANAEKSLNEAKALFQSSLKSLLEPKDGVKMKSVGELFDTYSGGTPTKSHKEYYEGGTIPWLRSGEVCTKDILSTEMFITEKGLKDSSAKYYPENTVVVAMYGATAAQVGILRLKATSNQAVCGILPNKEFLSEFIYYWFSAIQDDLASQAQGGAQPNISQQKIKKVLVPIYSVQDQKTIVESLDSVKIKADQLQANYDKISQECDALKQSILKQVFE